MIQIQDVSKSYNRTRVLGPISINFSSAKTHVIIGSSGCGKSTLLRLVNGLVFPDEGKVIVDDEVVTAENQAVLARKMGYVIQEGGLFPHLSAENNVTLMARQQKWPKNKIYDRCHELARLVNLRPELLKQFPQNLSGGQRQRVALMRALMLQPKILLFDEPFGALDPIIRANLHREFKSIFDKMNATVLLVTHDIHEAAYFGHTVTLLRKGEIIQTGEFDDLYNRPATDFVRKFVQAQQTTDRARGAI